ncbi:MAG: hypothetical protein FJY85_13010 [Deltaproteobacteria bacterium]|nr:hypothetical protein [Deltaproteobacteria bacterium]
MKTPKLNPDDMETKVVLTIFAGTTDESCDVIISRSVWNIIYGFIQDYAVEHGISEAEAGDIFMAKLVADFLAEKGFETS